VPSKRDREPWGKRTGCSAAGGERNGLAGRRRRLLGEPLGMAVLPPAPAPSVRRSVDPRPRGARRAALLASSRSRAARSASFAGTRRPRRAGVHRAVARAHALPHCGVTSAACATTALSRSAARRPTRSQSDSPKDTAMPGSPRPAAASAELSRTATTMARSIRHEGSSRFSRLRSCSRHGVRAAARARDVQASSWSPSQRRARVAADARRHARVLA